MSDEGSKVLTVMVGWGRRTKKRMGLRPGDGSVIKGLAVQAGGPLGLAGQIV